MALTMQTKLSEEKSSQVTNKKYNKQVTNINNSKAFFQSSYQTKLILSMS